jgi:hypothetical protein
MADTKVSALSEVSVPNLEDVLYAIDDPGGTPTSVKVTVRRLLGQMLPSIPEGRLTLESGVPLSTSDQTAKTSVYYTPYLGKRVSLYDGTRWRLYEFSEVTLALGTITDAKNYDVFLYDNAGTLTLELSAAWTNDTTRADALTTQDGIDVKSGATTRRLVGTIRTTSTTTTEDSLAKRFVGNMPAVELPRPMRVLEATNSWTLAAGAWGSFNSSTANRLQWVSPKAVHVVARCGSIFQGNTVGQGVTGIGVDSTTTPTGCFGSAGNIATGSGGQATSVAFYNGRLSAGFHFLQQLEYSDGTTITWYGDAGSSFLQSGIFGEVR